MSEASTKRLATYFFLLATLTPSSGLTASLFCTLTEIREVALNSSDGTAFVIDLALEHQIAVHLDTGLVLHPVFGNQTFSDVLLLDRGSEASSFKVVAYSPVGACEPVGICEFRNATYMEVRTWEQGPEKPFVVVSDSLIGEGVCR